MATKTKKKTSAPKKKKEDQPFVSTLGNIDSKFRFVHLASKRAKSLLKGAKAKNLSKAKTKNPIRLAQFEVKEGLIDFRVLPLSLEAPEEKDDRSFLGGDGVGAGTVEGEVEDAADIEPEEAVEEEEKDSEEFEAGLPEESDEEEEKED
ncbi:MAG: DNA-directed RNA polymerase subunit omega [Candidatus Aminicenantes bacterium]|nr:DNA-directed RNA polymerase subunit omega [Candidatus Aminicenantes bacterium]